MASIGWCKTGRAMAMWREMRAEGLKMNTIVYNSVIDAFARCGFMDGVTELLSAMEADGVVPDLITRSTIVKGYCVKGDLDKAVESSGTCRRATW